MKVFSPSLRAARAALLAASCAAAASANVGVFSGSGHTVKLTETAEIQLVRERVEIFPHRGPRLFAGGLPTDQVDFDCVFELRNLTDGAVTVQVGFPLDSQFLSAPYDPREASDAADLVHQYGFIARDETQTYHTSFQPHTKEFGSTFLWSMDFAPGETRTLRVSYGMPMSTSLGELTKGDDRESLYKNMGVAKEAIAALPWLERQGGALVESFQYITETGASWAGTIESAEFIVRTWPFEEYLTARAPVERSPLEADGAAQMFGPHPTRFHRVIVPAGYVAEPLTTTPDIEGSIRWEYAPFEPAAPIVGTYLKSVAPSTPEGALAFCQEAVEKYGADLAVVREYFAAWMGIQPANVHLRAFCESQRWYAPAEGRKETDLNSVDTAILKAVDSLLRANR